jgi:2-C-methyl-D-erythritol 4-phosphate cytidylyltransferase/2-C-methyl-D-erythritol 2,4-cyclodiphosphate synthase
MPADAAAIVVAAGRGERLGAARAKALVPLAGRPLLEWTLRELAGCPRITRVVVVVPPDQVQDPVWDSIVSSAIPHTPFVLVPGGARRRDSVAAGLDAVAGVPLVAVHDAARPFASAELFERVLAEAEVSGAAMPAVPVTDTVIREDERGHLAEPVARKPLRAVQTPQAFRAELLREAHEGAPPELDATDDAGLVHHLGRPVSVVPGDGGNVKITWPEDLALAEARISTGAAGAPRTAERRVGLGWDVHPLVEGRPFVLAGITVSEEFGPEGHSDGDPLAHALADAMLGAAGLGDIGTAFPDTDERWRGVSGSEILTRTRALVAGAGWRIAQLDAVLVTDRPKIAPQREAIRERLAQLLELPPECVSVKGKRTEGLGGLAGGRGVSCQAIVALEGSG